jgi:hypothetical protein
MSPYEDARVALEKWMLIDMIRLKEMYLMEMNQ